MRTARAATVASALALLGASPAAAHHVMGGVLPNTFLQGLLSGLGHPVIGLDHLAFVVTLGIAAALMRSPLAVIGTFVAFSMGGVVVHLAQLDIPVAEPLIALTVLLGGLGLVWSGSMAQTAWLGLFAIAGLLHGYAFGESIVGAEQAVLGAYLLGLALVMASIAFVAMRVTQQIMRSDGSGSPRVRTAGILLGCLGTVLLATTLMPG